MGACDPGLKETRSLCVSSSDLASSMGSGDVPVLGTPAILALAESACVAAIRDDLPDSDTTSVGQWAEVEHVRATPKGAEVCAEATLIGHHGRRLEFQVLVREGDEIIAKVRHRRVLVDRERFLEKVAAATPA